MEGKKDYIVSSLKKKVQIRKIINQREIYYSHARHNWMQSYDKSTQKIMLGHGGNQVQRECIKFELTLYEKFFNTCICFFPVMDEGEGGIYLYKEPARMYERENEETTNYSENPPRG